MDLNELFKIQEIIEDKIKSLSDIKEDSVGEENLFDIKFLALQVKTGEIANLTKCYKYYKIKRNIPREKIIVRYIDGMKFLLSIGNNHEFNVINKDSIDKVEKTDNVIKLFSSIFDDIRDLRKNILQKDYVDSLSIYIRLFARYVNLGECLGLSFEEVYQYYMKNNCLETV
ncbi:MAG: dUTP diphosphatase [Maledivibacter sp.]|jgi:dimeric dUTPase (all-alpha-NTP-PPase superfamily)|nr:dUTP diphosphatase [Maledivibacter sp.]